MRRRPDETAAPPAVLTNFGEWLALVDADQADGRVFDAQLEVRLSDRADLESHIPDGPFNCGLI